MVALIIYLVIIGVVLYLINTMAPIDGNIKRLINIVVILATIIWVLSVFGLLDMGPVPRIGRH